MVDFIDVETFEANNEIDSVPDEYEEWRDDEGIPVHTGLAVKDVNELETEPWDRTGQRGALINLYGMEGIVDLQLQEIRPDERTTRQHHLYEEVVYVTDGTGATVIEGEDDEQMFEWEKGALFVIPQNTPYRHVSLSDQPARLISQTFLPQLLTLVTDHSLIFEPDRNMWTDKNDDFYSGSGTIREGSSFPVVWEANFVPDIQRFEKLETWHLRGAGGQSVRFPLSQTSMWAHISEFPVGTYKKAHRHRPGAAVGVLAGTGYSLMWREGWDELVKIPWQEGSIFVPPARWYHQHFNTGQDPARYFAIHAPDLGTLKKNGMFDPHIPANYIEYVDEDPAIRKEYDAELAKVGLETKMPEECYRDPDYTFQNA